MCIPFLAAKPPVRGARCFDIWRQSPRLGELCCFDKGPHSNANARHVLPADSVVKERSVSGIPETSSLQAGRPKLQTENKKPGAERRAHSSHLTNSLVAQLMSTLVFVADLAYCALPCDTDSPSTAKVPLAIRKYSTFPLLVKPL